jgi:pilus assembly protein FimV
MGTLLDDNPLALAAGGGLLAALLGFGVYKLRRRSKSESGETSFLESRLQPDSFFGASGGQRIDTREPTGSSSSMSYSLSQLDAIGDVDPVAEADVYLAYGRDLQAEEILKEAMRSTPERLAIRTKLLEVYAKRRDIKGFESLAIQLFGLTRGEGSDWARAQELGQQVDPDNALYQLGGVPASFTGDAEHIEPLGASTMPQSVLPSPSQFGPDAARASAEAANLNMDLDLDLDFTDSVAPSSASLPTIPATMRPDPFGDSMSFDNQSPSAKSAGQAIAGAGAGLAASVGAASMAAAAKTSAAGAALDTPMTFDLSSISLDFDAPADAGMKKRISPITVPGQLQAPASGSDRGSDSVHDSLLDSAYDSTHENADPLLRKLELAEEFRQIGDTDGARDLLHEVLAKANGTLKTRAQGILDQLG